jgi:hypothetical protein
MKAVPALILAALLTSPVPAETIVEVVGQGLKEPFGTAFDAQGNPYVVEMVSGNRLFRVEGEGRLVHLAGREEPGYDGDGGPARRPAGR